ncbi:MAG: 4'-phosphopantetheinyl transferase superfamily protein [Eubacteriaceae bacterium]|jgi:phosphopantetheinyl transferase|nr:4'-phosphopantetheinyl transferase superfamily protein [Eubacteriaceae bacterium]
MYLYVFTGQDDRKKTGGHSDDIIRKSLGLYIRDNHLPSQGAQEILKTEAGKPYFRESDLYFSVSHTGSLCACLIGTQRVGLDMQQIRRTRTVSIAERYFSDSEIEYIEKNGDEGFFDIWVRKEAYVKFLGTTLAKGISKYDTVYDGRLREYIGEGTVRAFIENVDVGSGLKCACASVSKERICLKKIT